MNAVSQCESSDRVGFFLKEHSLDGLLVNVRPNNFSASREEIEQITDELRRMYLACQEVENGAVIDRVGVQYDVKTHTLRNLRYKRTIPRIMSDHVVRLTPITSVERYAFATLMGVHAKIAGKRAAGKVLFNTRVKRGLARKRILREGRVLLEGLLEKGDRITHSDGRIVTALNYGLQEAFSQYVRSDKERVAFLRGFFDAADLEFRIKNQNGYGIYKIAKSNPRLRKAIVETFFHLGVYPTVKTTGETTIIIEGIHDLARIAELGLDRRRASKRRLMQYLSQGLKAGPDVEQYHEIVEMAQELRSSDPPTTWDEVARRTGNKVSIDTLQNWLEDADTPFVVRRYRKILKLFPGVQENPETTPLIEEPIVAQTGDIAFMIEGVTYTMNPKVQQQYLKCIEATSFGDDDVDAIERALYRKLADQRSDAITLRIKNGSITYISTRYPYYESLEVQVDGEKVVFSNKAIRRYFDLYQNPIEDLDQEDIDFLCDQYQRRNDDGDLDFTVKRGVITTMDLKPYTSHSIVHSEGITFTLALEDEEPRPTSRQNHWT